jgi:L-rhamnose mutarotase
MPADGTPLSMQTSCSKEKFMTALLHAILPISFGASLVVCVCCAAAFSGQKAKPPARYGSVIGLRAEKLEEYKKLHAAVWPSILKMITACNIRNYSIYLHKLDEGNYYLFSYFEYVGDDFKADMAKMAADPETKRWWTFCEPCQKPLANRKPGEWWATMEEVFHED